MNPRRLPHLTRAVAGSAAIYVAAQVFIVWMLGPIAQDLFKLQSTWSFETFQEVIAHWDDEQVKLFLLHFIFDFVHPFIYGVALCLGLAHGMNVANVSARFDKLVWLPFIATACDLAENVFYLLYFRDWWVESRTSQPLFIAGNGAAAAKWAVAAITVLVIAILHIRRRPKEPTR